MEKIDSRQVDFQGGRADEQAGAREGEEGSCSMEIKGWEMDGMEVVESAVGGKCIRRDGIED